MTHDLNIGLIYGSTRQGRMCDTVAGWVAAELGRRPGLAVDAIDPAVPAVARAVAGGDAGAVAELKSRLGRADAFIVVTPEYNHSYPAPLKALIDSAKVEWQAKPVAFVSYGGVSGGLRAVEHLRGVFAELHAVGIRDGVSFANVRGCFGPDGRPVDPEGTGQALALMLARLGWWARALRRAREEQPYQEAVA